MIHDSHTVVGKDTERESVAADLTRHEVPVIYGLWSFMKWKLSLFYSDSLLVGPPPTSEYSRTAPPFFLSLPLSFLWDNYCPNNTIMA